MAQLEAGHRIPSSSRASNPSMAVHTHAALTAVDVPYISSGSVGASTGSTGRPIHDLLSLIRGAVSAVIDLTPILGSNSISPSSPPSPSSSSSPYSESASSSSSSSPSSSSNSSVPHTTMTTVTTITSTTTNPVSDSANMLQQHPFATVTTTTTTTTTTSMSRATSMVPLGPSDHSNRSCVDFLRRLLGAGATDLRINSLPVRSLCIEDGVDKLAFGQDTCAICLDGYDCDNHVRILGCRHVYHTSCIDPWLRRGRPTCPLCQTICC